MERWTRFEYSQAWRPTPRGGWIDGGGWVKKARTNKPNKEWGCIGSPAPSAVVRSCAKGVAGLWGTIDRRGFFVLWRRSDGARESVRALTGREAYATGWMHRPWWMGQKSAHE
jgi:hypothetical protein